MKESWLKVKQYFTQDTTTFAAGISGKKLFLVFVIFSIFGAYYEQILNLVKCYLADGTIFWESRAGVFYGPFSPIYGMGALIMVALFARRDRPWYQVFFYGFLFGGIFEYAISFLQEIFTGTTSWDYSDHFLNIGGRTTIPFMIAWGAMTVILIKVIYPVISKAIESIPNRLGNVLFVILFIFLSINMFVSWTALIRGAMRRQDMPPLTPVGHFYDRVFPDSYLQKQFPNMNFEPEKGVK